MNERKKPRDMHTLGDVIQRALRDPKFFEDLLDNREHPAAVLDAAGYKLSEPDLEALRKALAADTLHIEIDLKRILEHVRRREIWPTEVWRP